MVHKRLEEGDLPPGLSEHVAVRDHVHPPLPPATQPGEAAAAGLRLLRQVDDLRQVRRDRRAECAEEDLQRERLCRSASPHESFFF